MHPKLNQTKASLSVGCVPAGQERRGISQIAQKRIAQKLNSFSGKNLAIPLALMYNGLNLKGRMFKNTLPYAAHAMGDRSGFHLRSFLIQHPMFHLSSHLQQHTAECF